MRVNLAMPRLAFFFNSDYTHSQRYVSDAMGTKGIKPKRIVYV